jgi:hypothetical protein
MLRKGGRTYPAQASFRRLLRGSHPRLIISPFGAAGIKAPTSAKKAADKWRIAQDWNGIGTKPAPKERCGHLICCFFVRLRCGGLLFSALRPRMRAGRRREEKNLFCVLTLIASFTADSSAGINACSTLWSRDFSRNIRAFFP